MTYSLDNADEAFSILSAIIPETLIFPRRAQPTPAPEPAVPRSPSLAVHANTSMGGPAKPKAASAVQAIFGSVTRDDIVAQIKQELLTAPEGSRVALEADSVEIQGLDPEHDGPDRIKRLGSFEVLIYADATVEGKKGEPVKRVVKVVSQQDMPKEVSQTEAAESSS
ncbi:hypothetical protein F5Y17DRAFT_457690 [Xylariaceae sp. FL0594]|nr:hypothetical protein F5Y17DRAFT_457690 [Xylariaceae sp. FL0594]